MLSLASIGEILIKISVTPVPEYAFAFIPPLTFILNLIKPGGNLCLQFSEKPKIILVTPGTVSNHLRVFLTSLSTLLCFASQINLQLLF